MYRRVVTSKLTDVSEVRSASIIRTMMEAVRASGTSVNFNVTTWRYIPEDSKLHTRRREKLKSHIPCNVQIRLLGMNRLECL
jgi:ribosomal protein L14